jgi:hypothetical protein
MLTSGKDNQIGGIFLRLFDGADDSRGISFAISVCRIDLPDGDAHLMGILALMW